jgi:ribosomal protein S18 acetylase RimI-like enzyme
MEYGIAKKEDIPMILKLYEQLNPEEKVINIKDAKVIWKTIEKNNIKYFIAKEDGKVVSLCYIAIIPNLTRNGKPIGFIENVITDENYRRKGLGKNVMEMAIKFAKESNCYKALLQSNKKESSQKFYESIGFDGEKKRAFDIRL